jgi:hypothetical protein
MGIQAGGSAFLEGAGWDGCGAVADDPVPDRSRKGRRGCREDEAGSEIRYNNLEGRRGCREDEAGGESNRYEIYLLIEKKRM